MTTSVKCPTSRHFHLAETGGGGGGGIGGGGAPRGGGIIPAGGIGNPPGTDERGGTVGSGRTGPAAGGISSGGTLPECGGRLPGAGGIRAGTDDCVFWGGGGREGGSFCVVTAGVGVCEMAITFMSILNANCMKNYNDNKTKKFRKTRPERISSAD